MSKWMKIEIVYNCNEHILMFELNCQLISISYGRVRNLDTIKEAAKGTARGLITVVNNILLQINSTNTMAGAGGIQCLLMMNYER